VVAEPQHEHHKQWEAALLRHELELSRLLKDLLDYCNDPLIRDALGGVQAARLAVACQPSACDAIAAVIVADGTEYVADRCRQGYGGAVCQEVCVDLQLSDMLRVRTNGKTSAASEDIVRFGKEWGDVTARLRLLEETGKDIVAKAEEIKGVVDETLLATNHVKGAVDACHGILKELRASPAAWTAQDREAVDCLLQDQLATFFKGSTYRHLLAGSGTVPVNQVLASPVQDDRLTCADVC
jgi:hypothetical protein